MSLKETLSPEPRGRYTALLVVGEVLMALDDSGLLRIWSAKTLQLEGEVEVGGEHQFGARMLHPHTYLNKVQRRTHQYLTIPIRQGRAHSNTRGTCWIGGSSNRPTPFCRCSTKLTPIPVALVMLA